MRQRRASQLALGWRNAGTCIPEEIQKECQKLLAQLLRAVVDVERDEEGDGDERQDHSATS